MSAESFQVSETNPNDAVGGGGCACSETKVTDAEGPFLVFHASESASNISPHVVVCASCVRAGCRRIDSGDALAVGEPVIDITYEDVTTSDPTDGDSGAVPTDDELWYGDGGHFKSDVPEV